MPIQLDFAALLDQTPLQENIIFPDSPRFSEFLSDWTKAPRFTLDIETADSQRGNGLDHFRGKIRLIQIGLADERVAIVDCFKYDPSSLPSFFSVLEEQLANPNNHTIGMGIAFDLRWLRWHYGYICRGVRDIRVLSILLWTGVKQYSHSLKDIVKRTIGVNISKEQQASNWANPNLSNSQINYAANDITYTYRAYLELCKRLRSIDNMPNFEGKKPFYSIIEIAKIECECIPAFVEIELKGYPVDIPYAKKLYQRYLDVVNDLNEPVKKAFGMGYSANSEKLALGVYYKTGIVLLSDKKKVKEEADRKEIITKWSQNYVFEEFKTPIIPPGKVVCTASHVLFAYYHETGEELLLNISLCRSLKKCADAIKALYESAEQNNGRAVSFFTSLGSTGTGRSTSRSGGKSTVLGVNLQNIANPVNHPKIDHYKLPAVRTVIKPPTGNKLVVYDLASSHLRNAALLAGDQQIVDILSSPDPHHYLTVALMRNRGLEIDNESYFKRGGKKDPEIAEFRSLCKTFLYLSINMGGAYRLQQVLWKDYKYVTIEQCQEIADIFKEAFPKLVKWQWGLAKKCSEVVREIPISLKDGRKYNAPYAWTRSADGRFYFAPMYERMVQDWRTGEKKKVLKPNPSDLTSLNVISIEALLMKKAMKRIQDLIWDKYPEADCPLMIGQCHDEFVLEINEQHKSFAQKCYAIIAEEFTMGLRGVESGMSPDDGQWTKGFCDDYSEK